MPAVIVILDRIVGQSERIATGSARKHACDIGLRRPGRAAAEGEDILSSVRARHGDRAGGRDGEAPVIGAVPADTQTGLRRIEAVVKAREVKMRVRRAAKSVSCMTKLPTVALMGLLSCATLGVFSRAAAHRYSPSPRRVPTEWKIVATAPRRQGSLALEFSREHRALRE